MLVINTEVTKRICYWGWVIENGTFYKGRLTYHDTGILHYQRVIPTTNLKNEKLSSIIRVALTKKYRIPSKHVIIEIKEHEGEQSVYIGLNSNYINGLPLENFVYDSGSGMTFHKIRPTKEFAVSFEDFLQDIFNSHRTTKEQEKDKEVSEMENILDGFEIIEGLSKYRFRLMSEKSLVVYNVRRSIINNALIETNPVNNGNGYVLRGDDGETKSFRTRDLIDNVLKKLIITT